MNKTLVQHLQEMNDRMVEDGFKEDDRCAYLCKIGSLIMCTNRCDREEIDEGLKFIDEQLLKSDEVPEIAKMMIELNSLLARM